jgi:hypothetical protein
MGLLLGWGMGWAAVRQLEPELSIETGSSAGSFAEEGKGCRKGK